jgi:hypothetical protein
MWPAAAVLFIIWVVLKFGLGKGGFVHILLLTAISVAIIQFLTDRKTRYHNKSARREP